MINNELTPPFEAYRGDDPYIFVSYAHRDSNLSSLRGLSDTGLTMKVLKRAVMADSLVVEFSSYLYLPAPGFVEINQPHKTVRPFTLKNLPCPPALAFMGDYKILRYQIPEDRYQKKLQFPGSIAGTL